LPQQVSLFESLNGHNSLTGSLLRRPRWRTLLAIGGLLLALVCGYWLPRRRKRLHAPAGETNVQPSKDALLATKLYQALDRAMSNIGVARSAAVPPMLHATSLVHGEHPAGQEVLALTERYLDARYGDEPLSAEERRDFERRVRRVKDTPRQPAKTDDSTDDPPHSGKRTSSRPPDSSGPQPPVQAS